MYKKTTNNSICDVWPIFEIDNHDCLWACVLYYVLYADGNSVNSAAMRFDSSVVIARCSMLTVTASLFHLTLCLYNKLSRLIDMLNISIYSHRGHLHRSRQMQSLCSASCCWCCDDNRVLLS